MIITFTQKKEIKGFKLLLLCLTFFAGLINFIVLPERLFVNGGISFLICFFIFLFFLGIPLLVLEIHISKKYKQPAWKFWRLINNRFSLFGSLQIIFSIFLAIFYLFYFFLGFIEIFNNFKLSYHNGNGIISSNSGLDFYLGLAIVLLLFFLLIVLQKYVPQHQLCWLNITKFILLGLFLTIFIYVLTLNGSSTGVKYFFNFNHGKDFLNPLIWIDSSVLVFFTLFLSTGLISYNYRFTHSKFNGNFFIFTSATFNALVSFLISIIIYSLVGHAASLQHKSLYQFLKPGEGEIDIGYLNYFLGSMLWTFYLFSFIDSYHIFAYFFIIFFLVDILVIFLFLANVLITNVKYIFGDDKLIFPIIYYFFLILISSLFIFTNQVKIFEIIYFLFVHVIWWVLVFLEIMILFWFSKSGNEIFQYSKIHSKLYKPNLYKYLIKYFIVLVFFLVLIFTILNFVINIFTDTDLVKYQKFIYPDIVWIILLSLVFCVLFIVVLFSVIFYGYLKRNNQHLPNVFITTILIIFLFIVAVPLIIFINAYSGIDKSWLIDFTSLTFLDILIFYFFILVPILISFVLNYVFILKSYSMQKIKFFKPKKVEENN